MIGCYISTNTPSTIYYISGTWQICGTHNPIFMPRLEDVVLLMSKSKPYFNPVSLIHSSKRPICDTDFPESWAILRALCWIRSAQDYSLKSFSGIFNIERDLPETNIGEL